MSETGNLLCGGKQTAQTYRAVAGTGAGLSWPCHGALAADLAERTGRHCLPDVKYEFCLGDAGWLCQKQATCFAAVNKRRKHIVLWLGLALACLGLAMVLWLLILQNVPVGIAYPMLSMNFVWVTLAAVKLWHEPVSLRHWCGVAFIIGGIVILGSTV